MTRVFIFKCKTCNRRMEWEKWTSPSCCNKKMVRDYKSESIGLLRENIRAVKKDG